MFCCIVAAACSFTCAIFLFGGWYLSCGSILLVAPHEIHGSSDLWLQNVFLYVTSYETHMNANAMNLFKCEWQEWMNGAFTSVIRAMCVCQMEDFHGELLRHQCDVVSYLMQSVCVAWDIQCKHFGHFRQSRIVFIIYYYFGILEDFHQNKSIWKSVEQASSNVISL